MIKQKDLDLLADLAKLLKKYGPGSFESLRDLMTSGELPARIADILASSKYLAEEKPHLPRIERSALTRKHEVSAMVQLSFLKDSDPAKYDILERFYNQAMIKRILPSKKDATDIADNLGLQIPKKASRDTVINKITLYLSNLQIEKLESRIKEIVERGKHVQSLEDWADLILRQRKSSEVS